jgi:hypothetical protein
MRFMLTFSWRTGASPYEAIARFTETGAVMPPGARLLARWTRADFAGGFDLIETDDPKALAHFAIDWADLCDLTVVPVIDDDELMATLAKRGAGR